MNFFNNGRKWLCWYMMYFFVLFFITPYFTLYRFILLFWELFVVFFFLIFYFLFFFLRWSFNCLLMGIWKVYWLWALIFIIFFCNMPKTLFLLFIFNTLLFKAMFWSFRRKRLFFPVWNFRCLNHFRIRVSTCIDIH